VSQEEDLEMLFPGAQVELTDDADYLYRTVVTRNQLKLVLMGEVDRIVYKNFKNSVASDDRPRHDAYMRCWTAMTALQNKLEPPKKNQGEKWWQRDHEEWLDELTNDTPLLPPGSNAGRSTVAGKPAPKKARTIRVKGRRGHLTKGV
jgi:hypothetical protein